MFRQRIERSVVVVVFVGLCCTVNSIMVMSSSPVSKQLMEAKGVNVVPHRIVSSGGYSSDKAAQPSVILPNSSRDLAAWTPRSTIWSKIRARYVPKCDTYIATWDAQDDHAQVANNISADIQHCFEGRKSFSGKKEIENTARRRADIQCSIKTFKAFCEEHLETDSIIGYELKISDLCGVLATQCPAYHIDHVPVRWIETLHGPGTVYLDPIEHSYDGPLGNIVENTPPSELRGHLKWKEEAVQSLGIMPSQAEAGRPLVLIGRRWSEVARKKYSARRVVPVLHRSPTRVAKGQARVLLVLDVKVKLPVKVQAYYDCKCGLVH